MTPALAAVPIVTKITITVPIPTMIVIEPPPVALPISFEKALPVIVRSYPAGAVIRWAGPVSGMPPVAASHWIPVAIHPDIAGAGNS